MSNQTFLFTFLLCLVTSQISQAASGSQVEPLPKALEIQLALSAAPPYLRDGVTVYRLNPASGYVLESQGTNGFTCYVERTDYMQEDFNNAYIVPECQDAEGSRTIARVEFDVERLRAHGHLTPAELKQEILRRFQDGVYHAPGRPGIAYMLSPILGLYDAKAKRARAMNMPHFMFFAPNLTQKDIGGGPLMGSYPYLIDPGPMGYMIVQAGETEKARINSDSAELLKEACRLRSSLCMEGVTPGHLSTH